MKRTKAHRPGQAPTGHLSTKEIKKGVRQTYAKIASSRASGCCGEEASRGIYTPEEIAALPEGTLLGLGSGNPVAWADLRPGEHVLDIGSGPGADVLLAARTVGETGRAVGVDFTPEMVERARAAAGRAGLHNAEYHRREMESLPFPNASFDVVVSNCVINLSPEKEKVFREIHRVLRPGGRVVISDYTLEADLPLSVRRLLEPIGGCITGALSSARYRAMLEEVGLTGVEVRGEGRPEEERGEEGCCGTLPGGPFGIRRVHVLARKPED